LGYATWDPAFKSSSPAVTLSGGNLIAAIANTGVTGLVRSTVGQTSGKWYWEITCTSISDGTAIGVIDAAEVTGSAPGYSADGDGWVRLLSGVIINNTNTVASPGLFANGDVIGIAMDCDARQIKWYKNGTLVATLSGAGNIPTGATWYAAVGATGNAGANTTTANFGASAFAFTPPVGYQGLAQVLNFTMTSAGGVSVGGVATKLPASVWTITGGVSVGGTAGTFFDIATILTGSGGVSVGGSADVQIVRPGQYDLSTEGQPAGGIVLAGQAVVQEAIPHRPAGGMLLGGAAIVQESIPVLSAGGMLMGGAADVAVVFAHASTGGMLLGGAAPTRVIFVEIPTGGMILSGSAVVREYHALFVPSGGMKMGGEAVAYFLAALDVVTPENPYNEEFPGWAINLETSAPSTYRRLPANSFCQFLGRTFVANAAGIYEVGAANDAGQPIRASIQFPTSDYGAPQNKRISAASLVARVESQMRLAVATNKGDYHYYPINRSDQLAAVRVRLGQGLEGLYWTWRVENVNGGDFELESLAFTPAVLTRHARAR
jgi:hypothetical protein